MNKVNDKEGDKGVSKMENLNPVQKITENEVEDARKLENPNVENKEKCVSNIIENEIEREESIDHSEKPKNTTIVGEVQNAKMKEDEIEKEANGRDEKEEKYFEPSKGVFSTFKRTFRYVPPLI